MQTFLPFPDFQQSARVLDWRRLGKQRIECRQLLRAITEHSGWSKHPAAVMWRPYVDSLCQYTNAIDVEWISRGYKHTMELVGYQSRAKKPWWLGDDRFHKYHQMNLARKDMLHYSPHFPDIVATAHGYWWPGEKRGDWRFVGKDN